MFFFFVGMGRVLFVLASLKDEEQFFLGLGAKRLGKSTKRKLVEYQSQITTALRGGRPVVPATATATSTSTPATAATAGAAPAAAAAVPVPTTPTKRPSKKQSQAPSVSGGASPSSRPAAAPAPAAAGRSATGGDRATKSPGASGRSGAKNCSDERDPNGHTSNPNGMMRVSTQEASASRGDGGWGGGLGRADRPQSLMAATGRVGAASAASVGSSGSGARRMKGSGSVLLGAPRQGGLESAVAAGGGGGHVGGGAARSGGVRSAAEMAVSAVLGWEQGLNAAAAAAGASSGPKKAVPPPTSQALDKSMAAGKSGKERGDDVKRKAKKQQAQGKEGKNSIGLFRLMRTCGAGGTGLAVGRSVHVEFRLSISRRLCYFLDCLLFLLKRCLRATAGGEYSCISKQEGEEHLLR